MAKSSEKIVVEVRDGKQVRIRQVQQVIVKEEILETIETPEWMKAIKSPLQLVNRLHQDGYPVGYRTPESRVGRGVSNSYSITVWHGEEAKSAHASGVNPDALLADACVVFAQLQGPPPKYVAPPKPEKPEKPQEAASEAQSDEGAEEPAEVDMSALESSEPTVVTDVDDIDVEDLF